MSRSARSVRHVGQLVVVIGCLAGAAVACAQTGPDDFVTGKAAAAWEKWQAAMQAILARETEAAETAFGELLAEDPSPLRIALMAERTVMHTSQGGAVLLLEQDAESGTLSENAKRIADLLVVGREQLNEADDGWYFAAIGRFDVANANFRALLDSNPDPVALLEFADRNERRQLILVRLSDHPIIGPACRELISLLETGEVQIKADPTRIKEHIERLGGPPRAFENACSWLQVSGEYAVPFLVQYLRDPSKRNLAPPILRCLPTIGRPALNPLVMALRVDDEATRIDVLRALAQIGYDQSVPYVRLVLQSPVTTAEVQSEAEATLDRLAREGVDFDRSLSPAESFLRLAEDYYGDTPSLAADARLDTANVWYWRDGLLQNVVVPTPIFNEVMCMRCCEEALRLDATLKPALALWLAANFRREAQLPNGATDPTRPANFASGAYFAQSAGPEYCLMTLARAVADGDPAVALGAIGALRTTAGPASITSEASNGNPLAEALTFPDRMVRIRAALALGRALPVEPFRNHQNLLPVLAEAVALFGGSRNALVVDPDENTGNPIAAALRAEGYTVLTDAELLAGLEKVRQEVPSIDVIFIASDVGPPGLEEGLQQLRAEVRFAATPVVLIAKPADRTRVRDLVRADHRLQAVNPGDEIEQIRAAVEAVSKAVGAQPITADVGGLLAMEAVEVLRLLAVTHNELFPVSAAEPALLTAVRASDTELRLLAADVLGFIATPAAQQALANIALDGNEPQEMRVSMFGALAESAKRNGSLLDDDAVNAIITIVQTDENDVLRTAASQALGALNLPGDPASQIIRNQYQG